MASLFGALDTAVTGLTAQSAAFSNISDNIANSQTDGFKRTDTNFADYLSTSTAVTNDSGSVVATPEYENSEEGTISASTNPLSLAISGQGFFQVSQQSGIGAAATLGTVPEYSRDGSFTVDDNGYLVNGSNQVLEGWLANSTTGVLDETQQQPIKISTAGAPPVATSTVTLAANLPSTPSSSTITSQIDVYDAKGTQHVVTATYTQTASDTWTVSLNAPDAATPALGTAQIEFGPTATGNSAIPAGTIGSITSGTFTNVTSGAGNPAAFTFSADFGSGAQAVTLNLGDFGSGNGLTQYAGTAYQANSLTQNGEPPGNYTGAAIQSNGNVVLSYDNGTSKTVAKVPVIEFAAPDGLQRQNGQGFTATAASGQALATDVASGGSATLDTGSIEGSNVDIATEFTQLIVAQQAYAANAKVVTTASDMLTTTIDMKR